MELTEVLKKLRLAEINVEEARQFIDEITAREQGRICDECKAKGGEPLFIGSTIQ